MQFVPSGATEALLSLLSPAVEFLQHTCLLCLAAFAAALLLLALAVIGIESHDAKDARRILRGDLKVGEKKLHEIQEDLEASENAERRRLGRELAERFHS